MLNSSFWVDVGEMSLHHINPKAAVLSFTSFRMTRGVRWHGEADQGRYEILHFVQDDKGGRMGLGRLLGNDLIGALPHIAEETFNGIGDLNGVVHGSRKLDAISNVVESRL